MQEINGTLAPGQIDLFQLKGLKAGETLYVLLENTGGNLDPIVSILPLILQSRNRARGVPKSSGRAGSQLCATAASTSQPCATNTFLAWDDDSGPG